MGWLENFWPSETKDPLARLPPELRNYLEKESPVKYETAAELATRQQPHTQAASPTTHATGDTPPPAAPPQSMFPDGRYAHIWSTYRSQQELEGQFKSSSEKLDDILHGYKARKDMISKAAYENCSNEQMIMRECMSSGSVRERLTMCQRERKAFNRCLTMNTRLLKTLGYLEQWGRPAELEEDIQLHALDIYHAMLKQEEAIKKAYEAGEPIPTFPPLVATHKRPLNSLTTTSAAATVPQEQSPSLSSSSQPASSSVRSLPSSPAHSPGVGEQDQQYLASLPPDQRTVLQRDLDMALDDSVRAMLLARHKQSFGHSQDGNVRGSGSGSGSGSITELFHSADRDRQLRLPDRNNWLDKALSWWSGGGERGNGSSSSSSRKDDV